mgnify:CR=1 FL=1
MKTTLTFGGIPKKYAQFETAKTVIIPVPYDGTSTWQKGADKGPNAFLDAAEQVELYDIETDSEAYKHGIFLAEPIKTNNTPEAMAKAVFEATQKNLRQNKFVALIGGEHSISIGAIQAFETQFEDLTVVQLDAHADLRQEYQGSSYNHACAMYRANQTTNLVQVGIRSMDISEKKEMNLDNVFFAQDIATDDYWIDNALERITQNVYITIDLDVFDPAILPATGTPEPGGLQWYETLEFLNRIFNDKNVVGFDIVELCPNQNSKPSEFLAAKLFYKLISYKFFGQDFQDNNLPDNNNQTKKQTLKYRDENDDY